MLDGKAVIDGLVIGVSGVGVYYLVIQKLNITSPAYVLLTYGVSLWIIKRLIPSV